MKIACISTSRIPSDTANSIQVMKACQGLAKNGHAVRLMVPGDGQVGWEPLAERYALTQRFDLTWLHANPRLKRNDFAWLAAREARKMKADLLYTWTGQSAVFGLLWDMPVIYEVHDLPTGVLGPLWFRAFLRLKGKKRLLYITRALLKRTVSRFGAAAGEQAVIAPNGMDLEQYEPLPPSSAARAALGLPECPTVLCAGHLYSGRGVELFLGLAEQFSGASFVWVGGRPEDVAARRKQVQASGLRNVTFTGFVSQRRLPEYQAAADIQLMPYERSIAGSSGGNSADICSPMKMFDYLAAGRAILSSDLPVLHEVLNEHNARFATPQDLIAWSPALDELLRDPHLRERLGARARADALQYTWSARQANVLAGFWPGPART